MKIDVEGIRRQQPAAMRVLMAAARKSAKIGCRKVGAESLEDDVWQEVTMIFVSSMIDRFDSEYNVEPLLIEASRRVALGMIRKRRELLLDDDDGLLEDLMNGINGGINESNSIIDDLPVTRAEQQTALEAIRMSIPGTTEGNLRRAKGDAQNFVGKRKRTERVLSTTNARIREIRLTLGFSQEGFSARLNIPTATLLSYEYGRTPNVPDHIMDAAEEIYKQEKDVARKNQDDRPMTEIVAEWAATLHINKDDTKTISEIIGVAKSTVHRWLNGEMRPRPRELSGYMRAVKLMAKRLESGSKAASEIY